MLVKWNCNNALRPQEGNTIKGNLIRTPSYSYLEKQQKLFKPFNTICGHYGYCFYV